MPNLKSLLNLLEGKSTLERLKLLTLNINTETFEELDNIFIIFKISKLTEEVSLKYLLWCEEFAKGLKNIYKTDAIDGFSEIHILISSCAISKILSLIPTDIKTYIQNNPKVKRRLELRFVSFNLSYPTEREEPVDDTYESSIIDDMDTISTSSTGYNMNKVSISCAKLPDEDLF